MVKTFTKLAIAALCALAAGVLSPRAEASPVILTWGCTDFATCNQTGANFLAGTGSISLTFTGPSSNEEFGDNYSLALTGSNTLTLTDTTDASGTLTGTFTILSDVNDGTERSITYAVDWAGTLDGVSADGTDITTVTINDVNGDVENAGISNVLATPEPASLLLLGTGLLGLGGAVRRRWMN